jgi:hypothetical protein
MNDLKEWLIDQHEDEYSEFEWQLICDMSREIEMQEFINDQLESEADLEEQMGDEFYRESFQDE